METFPKTTNLKDNNNNLSIALLGNRFIPDQTLYEYLIEFLLVFVSAKNEDLNTGKMRFHRMDLGEDCSYWVDPRMGLRRFLFYEKTRKNSCIKFDEYAYKKHEEILLKRMKDIDDEKALKYLESIQDLLHGYAVVIKKRSWMAQALLPICPELIFNDAAPTENKRLKEVKWEENPITVDTKFDMTKHNFLARGGELYYLHLLQYLNENSEKREHLERLLSNMLSSHSSKISTMATFIQNSWEEDMGFTKKELAQELKLAYIPEEAYKSCEEHAVDELINYLSAEIHPITRIDILAKGVMFQVMRMMTSAVAQYLSIEKKPWIIDMRGNNADTVKKIANKGYKAIEADFLTAINMEADEREIDKSQLFKVTRDAKKASFDIFKAKGKEMQCIIPIKGSFERMTLSEDIIRFLVLALVAPGEKMTVTTFLKKLYDNYNIVIGPEEYKKSISSQDLTESLANSFSDNMVAFQQFLKNTGFLRELSDATSIVVNPYHNTLED
ncbi:hypothetical protein [Butyrivibrio sp. YAB3001]|uniref:hypothetical protein n=1 Tax=Butyrivibrio sp. YAB3001 TaxID=1520812 RepID=UPI0008F67089|nr:hypothetical protein [Butyrivibrio sp. YAB3001]SFC69911.1 hypothetical protein SAMN02910398_02907 [Butyrivibrio sp. YAB3001]